MTVKKKVPGRGMMTAPIFSTLMNVTLFSSLSKVSLGQFRQDILKEALNDSSYDPRIPPNFEDNFPTEVMVQLYVLSIDSVDEAAMDGDMDKENKFSRQAVTAGQREWVSSSKRRAYKSKHNKSRKMPSRTKDLYQNTAYQRKSKSGSKRGSSPMEFSMSIYLRQNWTDRRLKWKDKANLTRIEVDTKLMGDIWMPDLYFVNEKEAIIHDVTVPNRLLHLYPNGTIQSSIRISMTLSCDMYLEKYPHDEQTCSVSIGSYSYTAENVIFNWHPSPILMREGMTLPRFEARYMQAGRCEFKFDSASMILGNFSCITADFHLTRLFGYYVAQVYVPSVLIVVLSWVSFWIDIDAIPARVSLGLLTVLTMTTQSTGARNALPRVSYVKAIDVWMAVCLIFVFAALLEFAYVNVQSRVEKRRRESVMGDPQNTNGHFKDEERYRNKEIMGTTRRMVFLQDRLKRQRARMADKVSRVVFPIMFIVFNLIYWLVYCL